MGNSQSRNKIKKVFKEVVKIYKEIKREQDQQNGNQQNNYQQDNHQYQQGGHQQGNHQQGSHQQYQHQEHHQNNSYHPSVDVDDDEHYSSLRQKAHVEAEKRNDLYSRSQAAYQEGDGGLAKDLSVQGHEHDEKMKDYNRQAAEYIYSRKNEGRPVNEIDLHGLFVAEAKEKVEEAIKRCKSSGQENLVIIVGKGLHSPGQIAKLKPAIIDLVKKHNVSCQPNIPNPGCLFIEFGKGTGDLSWLDRFADRVGNGENCHIM
ncbi:hypothetical protein BY458DRAFT_496857 [Sporodiniella umbellata]|nr:hypothetical protein BY458DRAFT_496857 [Sporodiniella umbellata]